MPVSDRSGRGVARRNGARLCAIYVDVAGRRCYGGRLRANDNEGSGAMGSDEIDVVFLEDFACALES